MILLATLAGLGLIVIALRDIFQTLFHPSGKGVVSRMLSHGTWRAFRRLAVRYPAALQLAGPVGFLATIASWIALLVLGWAFVYWPRLLDGFSFDPGLDPHSQSGFVDASRCSASSLRRSLPSGAILSSSPAPTTSTAGTSKPTSLRVGGVRSVLVLDEVPEL